MKNQAKNQWRILVWKFWKRNFIMKICTIFRINSLLAPSCISHFLNESHQALTRAFALLKSFWSLACTPFPSFPYKWGSWIQIFGKKQVTCNYEIISSIPGCKTGKNSVSVSILVSVQFQFYFNLFQVLIPQSGIWRIKILVTLNQSGTPVLLQIDSTFIVRFSLKFSDI